LVLNFCVENGIYSFHSYNKQMVYPIALVQGLDGYKMVFFKFSDVTGKHQ